MLGRHIFLRGYRARLYKCRIFKNKRYLINIYSKLSRNSRRITEKASVYRLLCLCNAAPCQPNPSKSTIFILYIVPTTRHFISNIDDIQPKLAS